MLQLQKDSALNQVAEVRLLKTVGFDKVHSGEWVSQQCLVP